MQWLGRLQLVLFQPVLRQFAQALGLETLPGLQQCRVVHQDVMEGAHRAPALQGLLQFAILPLTITCFFEIGTATVIANGTGGLRGAILGSAVAGAMMIGLMIISIPIFRTTIADWMLIFGGNDFSLWGWIAAKLSAVF